MSKGTLQRFFLEGVLNRRDSILFLPQQNASRFLLYFPGDIQTFREEMNYSDNPYLDFINYSLEDTAQLLATRFPTAHVVICCPRVTLDHRSEFDHLLHPGWGVAHCSFLLQTICSLAEKQGFTSLSDLPLVLVHFSKGGLVANNFLAELATVTALTVPSATESPPHEIFDWETPSMGKLLPLWEPSQRIARTKSSAAISLKNMNYIFSFFNRVETIHWVDCHRFPTNPSVLFWVKQYFLSVRSSLPSSSFMFAIHGTPRQLNDNTRKFIATEHASFVNLLKTNNFQKFYVKTYLEDQPKTLETHFQLLNQFDTDVYVNE